MRKPLRAVVGLALILTACDRDGVFNPHPLASSPTPAVSPRPIGAPVYTMFGVVTRRQGGPVAGARVVALGQEPVVSVTDANGYYSLSGVKETSLDGLSPLLSASSPGYFTAVEFADAGYGAITKDTQLDFALDPLVLISVGEVAHEAGIGDERVCSHWGYGRASCARFGITVPSSGQLEVTLSGPKLNADIDVVGPDGAFVYYGWATASPARFEISVLGGSTYQLRIIGLAGPADFELTTALR